MIPLPGRKKVGLYGGTFDPIHFGHLNLALELKEAHHLDEILFCPAAVSPHKFNQPPAPSKEHRRMMVELAIEPIKSFVLYDGELKREGPSYTIDTVREILGSEEARKQAWQLYLLIGEDALSQLSEWKNVEELISLTIPLIGSRGSEVDVHSLSLSSKSREKIRQGMTKIPLLDISSTGMRDRIKKRLYCGHLIPAKVLDYIHKHHLYFL
jgi:nicotinate-nucleotide adenylyltransferase